MHMPVCVCPRACIVRAHTRTHTGPRIRQQECPTKCLHYLTMCRHPRCPTASPGHATTRSTPRVWTGQRSGAREQQLIIILTSSLSAAPPCGDILARMLASAEVRSSLEEDSQASGASFFVKRRYSISVVGRPRDSTEKKRFQFIRGGGNFQY